MYDEYCIYVISRGFSMVVPSCIIARLWLACFNLATIPFMFWSLISLFCLQRVLYEDMPTKFFFDLLQETDQEFVDRTGWFYRHDQPLYVPNPCVLVQPPHLPEGSRPYSPAAPSVFPAPLPSPNQHWVYHRSFALPWFNDQMLNNIFIFWTHTLV